MLRFALALALISSPAFADDDGIRRETIVVGQTIEREVGFAMGVACDDPAIVTVEMKTKAPDTNVLVVTGKKPGKTLCRAGTDPHRVSYVFEFVVKPTRTKR